MRSAAPNMTHHSECPPHPTLHSVLSLVPVCRRRQRRLRRRRMRARRRLRRRRRAAMTRRRRTTRMTSRPRPPSLTPGLFTAGLLALTCQRQRCRSRPWHAHSSSTADQNLNSDHTPPPPHTHKHMIRFPLRPAILCSSLSPQLFACPSLLLNTRRTYAHLPSVNGNMMKERSQGRLLARAV